jgi:hypothetical protein
MLRSYIRLNLSGLDLVSFSVRRVLTLVEFVDVLVLVKCVFKDISYLLNLTNLIIF